MKLRTTNDDLTTNDLTKATNNELRATTITERPNKTYEPLTTNDDLTTNDFTKELRTPDLRTTSIIKQRTTSWQTNDLSKTTDTRLTNYDYNETTNNELRLDNERLYNERLTKNYGHQTYEVRL